MSRDRSLLLLLRSSPSPSLMRRRRVVVSSILSICPAGHGRVSPASWRKFVITESWYECSCSCGWEGRKADAGYPHQDVGEPVVRRRVSEGGTPMVGKRRRALGEVFGRRPVSKRHGNEPCLLGVRCPKGRSAAARKCRRKEGAAAEISVCTAGAIVSPRRRSKAPRSRTTTWPCCTVRVYTPIADPTHVQYPLLC